MTSFFQVSLHFLWPVKCFPSVLKSIADRVHDLWTPSSVYFFSEEGRLLSPSWKSQPPCGFQDKDNPDCSASVELLWQHHIIGMVTLTCWSNPAYVPIECFCPVFFTDFVFLCKSLYSVNSWLLKSRFCRYGIAVLNCLGVFSCTLMWL